MVQRFVQFIKDQDLFTEKDKLLLALSGGADSLALFHLLREASFSFSAAHVNYSLREKESDEDSRFVQDLCNKYDIPCYIEQIPKSYWKKSMNIQAEARSIRYAFFERLAEEHGFNKILVAHHKDDNVESILMNITRGTGLSGLLGLKVRTGLVVRPLLFAERSDLENFLTEKGLLWREDSSNASAKYKRNRFRNEIIPLLKLENPSLIAAFDRMIENLTHLDGVFKQTFELFCDEYIREKNGKIMIEKRSPSQLQPFLYHYLNTFSFNRDQVNDLLKAMDKVGRTFETDTHQLYIDRDHLILIEKKERDNTVLEIVENASALLHPIRLKFSTISNFEKTSNENIAQFDKSKLVFPLLIRPWKEGDRIQPLGMKGTKKISDILIDKKVSQADKANIHVLLSGDEIIWIPGILRSGKAKVNEESEVIWRAELILNY